MLTVLIGSGFFSFSHAAPAWQTYNGHEYALTGNWSNWASAQTEASAFGASLVTIETETENIWLNTAFTGQSGYGDPWMSAAWIGLYHDGSNWIWASNGAAAGYIPAGSFNTGDTGIHAYIHLTPHPWPGTWNNDPGHDTGFTAGFYGIMERNAVPVPTTIFLLGSGILALAGVSRKKS